MHLLAVLLLVVASGVAVILGEGLVAGAAAMLALAVLAHRSRLASDVIQGEDRDEHTKSGTR